MILNTNSFKNVKRRENIVIKKKSNNTKNKIIKRKSKKSFNEYHLSLKNKNQNNNFKKIKMKKCNSFSKKDNPYKNTYFLNENINDIISNLKNCNNLKTELSTDFSSNMYNNVNTYSNSIPKKNKFISLKLKRNNSSKINVKILENSNFSNLLQKQEALLFKKGKKKNLNSSYQMPYIIKNNTTGKKYKYIGLYNSNILRDSKLKKEINNLMIINQSINFRKSKSFSSNSNINNIPKLFNQNINHSLDKDKTSNINIKFAFQRKIDEFIGMNRILMKQNYFRTLLKEKVFKLEKKNKKYDEKIKNIDNKINMIKHYFSYLKINNIINQDLKLLNIVLEKNELNNLKLQLIIQNYRKDIDKLNFTIKIHNNKRNKIIFWYDFLCKIKHDITMEENDKNYNRMAKFLQVEDLTKEFNYLTERIISLENKYKIISDEIILLKNQKDEINNNYELIIEKKEQNINEAKKELIILKEKSIKLKEIKNNIVNKKSIDFLNLEKYNKNKYNSYIFRENKNNLLIKKVGKLFENFIHYLKNDDIFTFEEKRKIKKIESEILVKKNKYSSLKVEKIKKYIFDIFSIMEKFINAIIYNIKKEKEIIGNEKFKKIINNTRIMKTVEKKLLIFHDKEENIDEEDNNITKNENKINFIPIKKVYIPFMAIKKENINNLKNENDESFHKVEKYKNNTDESTKKNSKNNLYYLDEKGIEKYNELFFD